MRVPCFGLGPFCLVGSAGDFGQHIFCLMLLFWWVCPSWRQDRLVRDALWSLNHFFFFVDSSVVFIFLFFSGCSSFLFLVFVSHSHTKDHPTFASEFVGRSIRSPSIRFVFVFVLPGQSVFDSVVFPLQSVPDGLLGLVIRHKRG